MSKHSTNKQTIAAEYATFFIQDAVCGIDLLKVQEINQPSALTNVPQAPDYVMGVMNLRGRIVTIIDICRKLGLLEGPVDSSNQNIIVRHNDEHIGLRVGRIGDVVTVKPDAVEAPPVNINGMQGKYFKGVYKSKDHLIGLLNIDDLLK